ncbi:MAG: patatin-like phospholipase family protein [Halanaerobiales bacterium]|nr:patatin-like phospholipase family protein [Halanaerobiales bacterium]
MKYGLILEGGGAKGSYQIGAVKALKEREIEIAGVAGTSIGALNGALIIQDDIDKAYDLWYNINPEKVFNIKQEDLDKIKSFSFDKKDLSYFWSQFKSLFENKGLEISLIEDIIDQNVDEKKIRESKKDFGIVTISLSDLEPIKIYIEEMPEGELKDYLMASANLPTFKQKKRKEKYYLDGGFYDNLPIDMLVDKGYKNIIAIRTHGLGITREIKNKKELNISYIEPSVDLGNILDFNTKLARRNLKLGYLDAQKAFEKDIIGDKYYVKIEENEDYFINYLLSIPDRSIKKIAEFIGYEEMDSKRALFEVIIPRLASLLNIDNNVSYTKIIVKVLEVIAEKVNLDFLKIYTFDQFVKSISDKYEPVEIKNINLPNFVKKSELLSKTIKDEIINMVISELFNNITKNEG